MKLCSRCGETKPFSEFHKGAAFDDGYQRYCKSCRKAYDHDYHYGSETGDTSNSA